MNNTDRPLVLVVIAVMIAAAVMLFTAYPDIVTALVAAGMFVLKSVACLAGAGVLLVIVGGPLLILAWRADK